MGLGNVKFEASLEYIGRGSQKELEKKSLEVDTMLWMQAKYGLGHLEFQICLLAGIGGG